MKVVHVSILNWGGGIQPDSGMWKGALRPGLSRQNRLGAPYVWRRLGNGVLRNEFSRSQEAKLAEAQQKAMLKGEAFPDVP